MSKTIVIACAIFLLYLALLPTNPQAMFGDADTAWHLAAGDLIRETGALPRHDPWSFTAGDYTWFNISWAWDVIISYLYEQYGWHGLYAFNSLLIAITLTLTFTHCFVRSQHGISAFIATMLLPITMLWLTVRPHQVSFLGTALFFLILSQVARREAKSQWLCILPLFMIPWVNMHGGFLIGIFVIGIYGLGAIADKDWKLVRWLLMTGIACLLASLCNPYGIYIVEATRVTLHAALKPMINEWDAVQFSIDYALPIFYILLFIYFAVLKSATTVVCSEKYLAYLWLFFALSTQRNLCIFAIVSAPFLALGLKRVLIGQSSQQPEILPWVKNIGIVTDRIIQTRTCAAAMVIISLTAMLALFTPAAIALYHTENLETIADVSGDIAFIADHYPKARFLNHYNLGGPLVFYGRGAPSVFIDGRAETAFPRAVAIDYLYFWRAKPGWDSMLEHYRLDGAILASADNAMMDRFRERKGWTLVYTGQKTAIFMRDEAIAAAKRQSTATQRQ